ncbi:peptide hydrolase [Parastagonospora nodorum]|nr:peptide hydrolase [Parastagonospora nodorum]KAH4178226.1 peptide hydrolase [Parastagonospora nodorum]KAH4199077.1 peptide hydrolase [Parastagonospora nodorum]KAH4290900.1 peptide hydrolase [Parastagonospora nodorum]KAH4317864.1 peptide hydrolase [Parastagonospora nodorum]
MKYSIAISALAAGAAAVGDKAIRQDGAKPAVDATLLKADITKANLLAGAQKVQDIAYATKDRNRFIGTAGHNATVEWLKQELEALDGYYNVTLQTYFEVVQLNGTINAFSINGTAAPAGSSSLFEHSPTGAVSGKLVLVSNAACNFTDYPDTLAGNIALIPRGVCEFGLKSAWAGSKGAIGAVMYGGDEENARCPTRPSLGNFVRPEGKLIPSVCINRAFGEQFVSAVANGANLSAVVDVTTDIRNISTTNVLATTVGGDHNNKLALGAHSDSTNDGPGINDNGSGVVGVLEVAKALTKYKVKNAVMFGFWTANMLGLLGSAHYVNNLSADEAAKIRAYVDVDVIASKNYINGILDGDGSRFNDTGPPGCAEIEAAFQKYFTSLGQNFTATEFDGRGDVGIFVGAGIPGGGLFTGASRNKTEEEARMFGGTAGTPLDPCSNDATCDTVTNLEVDAWERNVKGIATLVAQYASSWDGFPERIIAPTKRSVVKPREISHGPRRGPHYNPIKFDPPVEQ